MSDQDAFAVQGDVRKPWRKYLDSLATIRPEVHRYCCRLTGNVWDGEDLLQDALVRVFSLLGKIDANLENPRAYIIRTATNLWIDSVRRRAREQAALQLEAASEPTQTLQADDDARPAARALFQKLHPQERAAILMKEVLDLSLDETAAMLKTSTGAVKSALSRARDRLADKRQPAGFDTPPKEMVERFMVALRDKDMNGLRAMCAADLTIELVGGAESNTFEKGSSFFQHAHMVMPQFGFGENPHWQLTEYRGEPIVIGWRTLDGVEGLNEIHRLEVSDGKITRVRCYCFAPDTLRVVAEELGLQVLKRPYRSPSFD
jgi:RNA polymerase sigma-70 factor, ECF subfamily